MGLEAAYFIGGIRAVDSTDLTLSYRYRNRALDRMAEDVTRERYRRNQT
jgi:hypothetical protein